MSGGNAARGGRVPDLLKQSPLEKQDHCDLAHTRIHAGSLRCHWFLVNARGSKRLERHADG
jgi:hypothetical protein